MCLYTVSSARGLPLSLSLAPSFLAHAIETSVKSCLEIEQKYSKLGNMLCTWATDLPLTEHCASTKAWVFFKWTFEAAWEPLLSFLHCCSSALQLKKHSQYSLAPFFSVFLGYWPLTEAKYWARWIFGLMCLTILMLFFVSVCWIASPSVNRILCCFVMMPLGRVLRFRKLSLAWSSVFLRKPERESFPWACNVL